jgi:hypothetical protein
MCLMLNNYEISIFGYDFQYNPDVPHTVKGHDSITKKRELFVFKFIIKHDIFHLFFSGY